MHIYRHIQQWHEYARKNLPTNVYMVNLHYLRHVPDALRKLGPLRGYGTRGMERAVGFYNRRIKSTKAPGVNAGNKLVHAAAHKFRTRIDANGISKVKGKKN